MTETTISIEPNSDRAEVSARLEERLLDTLANLNTQTTNATIVLSARDTAGALVGGVSGATSYGWLLVKLLWVSEDLRGMGIGKRLMLEAEEHARGVGCHGAWLDTSSAKARAFYVGLGYRDFGVLENGAGKDPVDHSRWFMKKSL